MYFDFRDKPDRLCVKEMVHGYNISSCLFVAVELELADLLAGGPLALADLAQRSGTDPDALKRILRLLDERGDLLRGRAGQMRTHAASRILAQG